MIALLYRHTRTRWLSLASLRTWVSHDSLNGLVQNPLVYAAKIGSVVVLGNGLGIAIYQRRAKKPKASLERANADSP